MVIIATTENTAVLGQPITLARTQVAVSQGCVSVRELLRERGRYDDIRVGRGEPKESGSS